MSEAKITNFPHSIEQKYCQYRCEHVDATIHRSNNGTINNVCLCAVGCKKFRFCDILASYIKPEKIKMNYVKCCGICRQAGWCRYLRKRNGTKEPIFISAKERDYPEREAKK
jgi:hypothetical protein